jgi:NTE family protein
MAGGRRPRIAFVGSGGAAKGIAHLGVLKACEELGIVPDIFVGTSAGAIVGATYGQGLSLDVILDSYRLPWKRRYKGEKLTERVFLEPPPWRTWLRPGHLTSGLLSIDGFERFLRRQLPCNDFRRLDRTILVTATDIDAVRRVVFGRGFIEDVPVSRAVAASCCVPILFRPYEIDGRFYVDGELVRTLSADLAVGQGAEVVIISNVYKPHYGESSERSFARRGMPAMVEQSLNVLLSEKERRGLELYHYLFPRVSFIQITPNIGSFSFLNRFRAKHLVQRGYREALKELTVAKSRGIFDPRAVVQVARTN